MRLKEGNPEKANTQNNYIHSIMDTFSNKLNSKKNYIDRSKQQLAHTLGMENKNEWDEISLQDINLEAVLSQVEVLDKKHEYYARWFSSHIFLVEADTKNGTKRKLLIIKDRIEKNKNSNNKVLNEYNAYVNAYQLVKESDISEIAIPKPYWVVNNHDWEMMLMLEYIEWITLFGLKIGSVLPILHQELEKNLWKEKIKTLIWEADYSLLKSDREIKEAMHKLLNIFRFHCKKDFYEEYLDFFERYNLSDAYKWVWFESKMAGVFDKLAQNHKLGFLDKNSVSFIKNELIDTFQLLHKNEVYHNDVNHRNIILWEDWKVYIIDFDKTTSIPKVNKANPDPKYMDTYRWTYIEWDFRIINHFSALEKTI